MGFLSGGISYHLTGEQLGMQTSLPMPATTTHGAQDSHGQPTSEWMTVSHTNSYNNQNPPLSHSPSINPCRLCYKSSWTSHNLDAASRRKIEDCELRWSTPKFCPISRTVLLITTPMGKRHSSYILSHNFFSNFIEKELTYTVGI